MSLEGLINIAGFLAETVPKFHIETIQHSDEITLQRKNQPSLKNEWFWTADFPLYHIESDEVILYLARGKDNLIFKNIKEATLQLDDTGNYIPKKEEAESVIKQETTLKVRLSQLRLIRDTDEYSHFEIDTADYKKLNSEERAFAERVYGQGQAFVENMALFKDAGKKKVCIYVLNPSFVKDYAQENGYLVRPARLSTFQRDPFIFAAVDDDSAKLDTGCLRGELKK